MDRCTEFLNYITIRISVARFGLWYLFRSLALYVQRGRFCAICLGSRYFLGALSKFSDQ